MGLVSGFGEFGAELEDEVVDFLELWVEEGDSWYDWKVPEFGFLKVDSDSLGFGFDFIVDFVGLLIGSVEGVVLGFELLGDLLVDGDLVELELEGFELLFQAQVLLF